MKEILHWHLLSGKDTLEIVGSRRTGLSSDEIEGQKERYGINTRRKKKLVPWFTILFYQLSGPFILILLFAAGVSLFLGEFLDVFVIGVAILVNTALGFIEEYKADRSVAKLQDFLPREARVIRNGVVTVIPSEEIVVGDVLLLRSGDNVTADARILEAHDFTVDESSLTGESRPVEKQEYQLENEVSTSDQINMVFAGTVIVGGEARSVVVAVGMETQIGRVTTLVEDVKEEKTPLQNQLKVLARFIGVSVILLGVVVFTTGVLRGRDALEMLYVSVALAVAAVPEGLIVALTVILAISMQRILKRKALMRKLVATETLGSVSVICLDKTGTITTGKMSVAQIRLFEGIGTQEEIDLTIRSIVHVDTRTKNGEVVYSGSPTDTALFKSIESRITSIDAQISRIRDRLIFDSNNKFAASLVESNSGNYMYVIGAPDILLEKADMSEEEEQWARNTLQEMTQDGMRVVLACKKEVHNEKKLSVTDVGDLRIIGFIGLEDPIREDAAKSIMKARSAGLLPIMITGDHPETARLIAEEVGLLEKDSAIATGKELDTWEDHELESRVEDICVYARVMPQHKLAIIKALHARGKTVAMTGDGVNDAPAIKAADIGIAFGSGTDVAKETADMILLKNDFKTIIHAIREGRIVFENIRKVVTYLLIDSFSEIIIVMGALAFNTPLPILPAQILWINLVTDGLPSLALTFEPAEEGVMKEKPRKRNEPIMNAEMKTLIFFIGLLTATVILILFLWMQGRTTDIDHVRTFVFFILGIDSLIYVFATRKFRKSIFRSNPFENIWLVFAVFIGLGIQFLPYLIPVLREAFRLTPLNPIEWLVIFVIAISQLILIEIVKEIYHTRSNKKSL